MSHETVTISRELAEQLLHFGDTQSTITPYATAWLRVVLTNYDTGISASVAPVVERRSVGHISPKPPAPVAVVLPEFEPAFEAWWESDGQYCRSGGGSYEKTFAYRAYEACLDKVKEMNR